MGNTAKRIAARKAKQVGRASMVAHNQAEALQRHARQAAQVHAPAVFGFDPWLDSDHDFEAFGEPMWCARDSKTGEILNDVWPAGFRGELRYSGTGEDKDEASATRDMQYKRAVAHYGSAYFRNMTRARLQTVLAQFAHGSNDLGYKRGIKAKHTQCSHCDCLLPVNELAAQGYTASEIEEIRASVT